MTKLTSLETEVIGLFVHLARLLSVPKSVAEIYGLLFIAVEPLAMEDIIERLNLSKGSASQGLKLLRGLGAVQVVYVGGKRNDHYEAETELRKLVDGFLKDKIEPHFHTGGERLSRIESLVNEAHPTNGDVVLARLEKLKRWKQTGREFLPLALKCLR